VSVADRAAEALRSGRVLLRSGALHPEPPGRLVRMLGAYRHWGATLGGAFATAAARYGDRVALVDELGPLSYTQLDRRTDAVALGLRAAGIGPGHVVGVMCRNHRYFLDVTGGLAKIGADALYCNTGFAGPQLHDVMAREHADLLVHDDEFTDVARAAGVDRRIVAWGGEDDDGEHLERMIDTFRGAPAPSRPRRAGRTIILTSGTTGTPKGAAREQTTGVGPAAAMLERIPYRAREPMVVAAPCFHSWGFANALVGLLLGDTLVLERTFDPEATLAAIARNRAATLVAVPVMLLRILELAPDVRARHDTASLRLVPLSGSSLPGDLATRFMDEFGEVVYNLYGSTEVGFVSVATPADLRAAPATAGRPPAGTTVRLLDDGGRAVGPGETGRIFVRSDLLFEGYTDGATKTVVDGYMHTGDTGHVDAAGLLFVDGRDDDMIVSGGENVFPGEVEDVLAHHPDVQEAAVVGVPDAEFGHRLHAYVVTRPGAGADADELRAHVRTRLARHKVPREITFVGELPRNATGKVRRSDLPGSGS